MAEPKPTYYDQLVKTVVEVSGGNPKIIETFQASTLFQLLKVRQSPNIRLTIDSWFGLSNFSLEPGETLSDRLEKSSESDPDGTLFFSTLATILPPLMKNKVE